MLYAFTQSDLGLGRPAPLFGCLGAERRPASVCPGANEEIASGSCSPLRSPTMRRFLGTPSSPLHDLPGCGDHHSGVSRKLPRLSPGNHWNSRPWVWIGRLQMCMACRAGVSGMLAARVAASATRPDIRPEVKGGHGSVQERDWPCVRWCPGASRGGAATAVLQTRQEGMCCCVLDWLCRGGAAAATAAVLDTRRSYCGGRRAVAALLLRCYTRDKRACVAACRTGCAVAVLQRHVTSYAW